MKQLLLSLLALLVGSRAFAAPLDHTHPSVRAAIAAQDEVTPGLLKDDAILGTAVSVDDNGRTFLLVYADKDDPAVGRRVRALPAQVRGVGVKVELTDKFRALKGKPGGGGSTVSHTAKQTLPIQLGTSGGWSYDLANGYCCGGTLGSLIQANGRQYILSNYHVFEADIVAGGNGLVATSGDPVIQPGLIDVGCSANNAQTVAGLVKLGSLPNNNVDCSIAEVVAGMVTNNGSILEIGPLAAQTVGASLNQPVKKSGRTSGLTRSKVSGLNATIKVTYDNECAGGTAFTKTFTGQIVVGGSGFLKGGDSGSLLVEDVANRPRAVGLLYAGSSTSAIANPIQEVLTFIGGKLGSPATMVGY